MEVRGRSDKPYRSGQLSDSPTCSRGRRRVPTASPGAVVFVSGYAEEAFRKNLPEGEQFKFLPKPFTLKQLVATVKETMG